MIKYRPADKLVVIATHGRGLFTSDIFVTNPIADFIIDANATCAGSLTVHFTDTSLKPNASWAWDIDNNGSTDYTTQNPTHTYASPGVYSVKLTTNSGNTSVTKQDLILVMSNPPTVNTGCTLNPNSNNGNNSGIGIFRFAVGYIDKSSLNNDGYYQNYVCTQGTPLKLNTTYPATISTGVNNPEGARYYIDYNDNAIFEVGESVITFPNNTDGTRTISFTTPSSGVVSNKCLRSRVISRWNFVPTDACNTGTYGQAEDYTVYFKCQLLVSQVSGTGEGSLPSAINCANPGDTIRLSAALAGQTINIGSSSLILNKNLVIIADAPNISITGSGAGVFEVISGITVGLSGMNIIAGTSLTAGAINNAGILKLTNVSIHRNSNVTGAILLRNSPGGQITTLGICFIQQ
jgi:PKD repeat protein